MLLIGAFSACQGQECASAQDMEENKVAVSENRQEDTAEEKVLIAYFTLGKNADYPEDVETTTSVNAYRRNRCIGNRNISGISFGTETVPAFFAVS